MFRDNNKSTVKRPRSVFHIENSATDEDHEDFPVYNVGDVDDVLIKCCVGGVDVVMLIDSGSKHNLIDDTTWELMKLRDVKISNERWGYSGTCIFIFIFYINFGILTGRIQTNGSSHMVEYR